MTSFAVILLADTERSLCTCWPRSSSAKAGSLHAHFLSATHASACSTSVWRYSTLRLYTQAEPWITSAAAQAIAGDLQLAAAVPSVRGSSRRPGPCYQTQQHCAEAEEVLHRGGGRAGHAATRGAPSAKFSVGPPSKLKVMCSSSSCAAPVHGE